MRYRESHGIFRKHKASVDPANVIDTAVSDSESEVFVRYTLEYSKRIRSVHYKPAAIYTLMGIESDGYLR